MNFQMNQIVKDLAKNPISVAGFLVMLGLIIHGLLMSRNRYSVVVDHDGYRTVYDNRSGTTWTSSGGCVTESNRIKGRARKYQSQTIDERITE